MTDLPREDAPEMPVGKVAVAQMERGWWRKRSAVGARSERGRKEWMKKIAGAGGAPAII